jgi:tetratricopeptide (TPR) repeat protein
LENEPTVYEQAMEKYARALDLKPKSYNALRNWGVCLAKYAYCLYSKDRNNFQQAEKFYELAGLSSISFDLFSHHYHYFLSFLSINITEFLHNCIIVS